MKKYFIVFISIFIIIIPSYAVSAETIPGILVSQPDDPFASSDNSSSSNDNSSGSNVDDSSSSSSVDTGGSIVDDVDNNFYSTFFNFIGSVISSVFTVNSPFGILLGGFIVLFFILCIFILGGFIK